MPPLRLALATDADRELIYRLRHDVYARELGQHPENQEGALRDPLDAFNVYLCAWRDGTLAGFVSVTPPGHGRYSIDKYVSRSELPFPVDDALYELRLLTVPQAFRGSPVATLLMYAAGRWIESHGGSRIVAIGRREIVNLYRGVGLEDLRDEFRSGAVTYRLMSAEIARLRAQWARRGRLLHRLEREVDWDLPMPFRDTTPCYHGGAFFEAIGEELDAVERREGVINADVLDAWFDPSPGVLEALKAHLPWLLRTSPPTNAEGLTRVIARARGVDPACVLPGSGSSSLIYMAMQRWLQPSSRVVILDPTYGEYAHLLERVIGCRVERLRLRRDNAYRIDLPLLAAAARRDLLVIVNPNNPTGNHVPRSELIGALQQARGRVWIDEAYVDYAGADESLERFAAASDRIFVCKSMSKAYALSGARVGYLCGPASQIRMLRPLAPPWGVGLPGQLAAVRALQDVDYYRARWAETGKLREELAAQLRGIGLGVVSGAANWLLVELPVIAVPVLERCRSKGLYLRDVSGMGTGLSDRMFRMAVKDGATNRRMVGILKRALQAMRPGLHVTRP